MTDHDAPDHAEQADPTRPPRRPQVRSACGWLDAPTRLECDMDEEWGER